MNSGKYLFSQLVEFLPKRIFDGIVKKYGGDKYVKTFTCWNQLLVMMFGQLSSCDSLREVICIIDAIKNKSYHLGFGTGDIKLSNVSYANANRDYRMFEEFAYYMIDLARLYRISIIDSFFVIRQKSHLNYEIVDGEDLLDDPDNVLLDQTISLTGYQSKKKYPGTLRRIVYYAPELKRTFTFLTNNFALKAGDIALLYKQRWQVELFFRWIKQHLRVTSFWGNTENAVRIQIYVAVIAYCLVAIVEHDCVLKRSTFNVLRVISRVLTDKTPVRDLFNGPEKLLYICDQPVQLEFVFKY